MADARGVTQVVAALIFEGDRFLACQRPAYKTRGLLWEFVGGKVEEGETRREALIRECREELAVTVEPGEVFMELTHEYPDMTVELTLFYTRIVEGRCSSTTTSAGSSPPRRWTIPSARRIRPFWRSCGRCTRAERGRIWGLLFFCTRG